LPPKNADKGETMKTFLRSSVLALALFGFQRAQAAPYTNYMDSLSNVIAAAYDDTADLPKEHKALGRALAAFNKPSTSVAGDYKIFVAIASALLPIQASLPAEASGALGDASTNAFTNFTGFAAAELDELSARTAAVTPFQPLRRAASNQLAVATKALQTADETDNVTLSIVSVGLGLNKLANARKLVVKAEAKQGFALDSVQGLYLNHAEKGESGTVWFVDDILYVQGDDDAGTYNYTRTGLNTATLELTSQNGDGVTTVKMRFTSRNGVATEGTFSFRNSDEGSNSSGTGTFTTTTTD
jgi:hypothetical protein